MEQHPPILIPVQTCHGRMPFVAVAQEMSAQMVFGLFQFPVPAVEGGSNLMEKSPYAALRKPLHTAQFKARSVQGHLLSSCICAFILCSYVYICLV